MGKTQDSGIISRSLLVYMFVYLPRRVHDLRSTMGGTFRMLSVRITIKNPANIQHGHDKN